MSLFAGDDKARNIVTTILESHHYPDCVAFEDSVAAEVARIISLRATLKQAYLDGIISVHGTQGGAHNMLGVSRIRVLQPDKLFDALVLKRHVDWDTFGRVDIWRSTFLNVHHADENFQLWRVWVVLHRMGFRPNKISSTDVSQAGPYWENVFKSVTKWTFGRYRATLAQPIYYATLLTDTSDLIVTSLLVQCVECGCSVPSTRLLEHVEVCRRPRGMQLEPPGWTNAYPPTGVLAPWTTGVQETPPAPGSTEAYSFEAFPFGGPDTDTTFPVCVKSYAPPPGDWEPTLQYLTSGLAPPLTAEEREQWSSDSLNWEDPRIYL